MTETNWQLWRQDDNGNRFLVAEFDSREAAELRLAELTRSQHRQIYWTSESAGARQNRAEDLK
jgi:hypothetical protein